MEPNNGQAIDMKIVQTNACTRAVWRITDTSAGCSYAATNPAPSLYLAPVQALRDRKQGRSQMFTASFHYVSVPDGIPVLLNITSALRDTSGG